MIEAPLYISLPLFDATTATTHASAAMPPLQGYLAHKKHTPPSTLQ